MTKFWIPASAGMTGKDKWLFIKKLSCTLCNKTVKKKED